MDRRAFVATVTAAILGLFGRRQAGGSDIVLSFVHANGRVDVPATGIEHIEARSTTTFFDTETQRPMQFHTPKVEICLSRDFRDGLAQLTQRILDEPLDIVVGGNVIVSPIVREPFGTEGCFSISAFDVAEAEALAAKLRAGRGN